MSYPLICGFVLYIIYYAACPTGREVLFWGKGFQGTATWTHSPNLSSLLISANLISRAKWSAPDSGLAITPTKRPSLLFPVTFGTSAYPSAEGASLYGETSVAYPLVFML